MILGDLNMDKFSPGRRGRGIQFVLPNNRAYSGDNAFLHAFGCDAHKQSRAVQEMRVKRPLPDLRRNDGESL